MLELQLVDYIKKAKGVGQTDEQTKSLLYKNGWTAEEVSEAFAALGQPQPQVVAQPQSIIQPKVDIQQKPEPKYETKPVQTYSTPVEKKKSHFVLKLLIVLFILMVLGVVGYFSIPFLIQTTPAPIVENNAEIPQNETPTSQVLSTANLATVLADYDITKMIVLAFSKAGDKVVYCAPKKVGNINSCFLNGQILTSPYSYRPIGAGFSPDGTKLVFVYLDPVTKQSFVSENSNESVRYNGTISGLGFSNDSQNVMYIVNGTDKKSFVVLNGNSGAKHDKIYGTPSLSSDGNYVFYGARDGQSLFWVADQVVATANP